MKNANLKKLFALLSATLIVATSAACSCDSEYLNGPDSPSASDTASDTTPDQSGSASAIALQAPMHLSFDEENSTLTWEAVDNAVHYLVDFNGEILEVYGEEAYVIPTEGENTFKVQAVGDGVNYTDSEWSEEYCYVMPAQVSVYEKVSAKLAEAATEEGLVLEKVIGIGYVSLEANKYGDHIIFETVCSKDGVSAHYQLSFHHENPTSVAEMLQTFELATLNDAYKTTIVEYNSVSCLLGSDALVGALAEFQSRGYEISAIQSCVQKGEKVGSKFRFNIIATFRAQREGDVQYFTAQYKVDILNPAINDIHNYETSLFNEKYRDLKEVYCIVHEQGGTLEYIREWAKENDPNYKSEE